MIDMQEIHTLVEEKGMSQKDVANLAGVHPMTATNWLMEEHGAVLHNLEAFVNVLGYTIDIEPIGENYE